MGPISPIGPNDMLGRGAATRFQAFAAHSVLSCRPLRPGEFVIGTYLVFRLRQTLRHRLDTPSSPAIRFTRALNFVASLVRNYFLTPRKADCSKLETETFSPIGAKPFSETDRSGNRRMPALYETGGEFADRRRKLAWRMD